MDKQALRDHFAGIALSVEMADRLDFQTDLWRDEVAVNAYKMADAMLKARTQILATDDNDEGE